MSLANYKVYIVQAAPMFLDLYKSIDKVISLVEEASKCLICEIIYFYVVYKYIALEKSQLKIIKF